MRRKIPVPVFVSNERELARISKMLTEDLVIHSYGSEVLIYASSEKMHLDISTIKFVNSLDKKIVDRLKVEQRIAENRAEFEKLTEELDGLKGY